MASSTITARNIGMMIQSRVLGVPCWMNAKAHAAAPATTSVRLGMVGDINAAYTNAAIQAAGSVARSFWHG